MPTGFIKKIVDARGFGFVAEHGTDTDYFFHIKSLMDLEWGPQLVERQVRFDIGSDPRTGKTRAVNVRPE